MTETKRIRAVASGGFWGLVGWKECCRIAGIAFLREMVPWRKLQMPFVGAATVDNKCVWYGYVLYDRQEFGESTTKTLTANVAEATGSY